MSNPWDRLETETAKAYSAFCCYLLIGPKRSLLEAFRRYEGKSVAECRKKGAQKVRQTPPFFRKWSSSNNWVERSTAYDSYKYGLEIEKDVECSLFNREMALREEIEDIKEMREIGRI